MRIHGFADKLKKALKRAERGKRALSRSPPLLGVLNQVIEEVAHMLREELTTNSDEGKAIITIGGKRFYKKNRVPVRGFISTYPSEQKLAPTRNLITENIDLDYLLYLYFRTALWRRVLPELFNTGENIDLEDTINRLLWVFLHSQVLVDADKHSNREFVPEGSFVPRKIPCLQALRSQAVKYLLTKLISTTSSRKPEEVYHTIINSVKKVEEDEDTARIDPDRLAVCLWARSNWTATSYFAVTVIPDEIEITDYYPEDNAFLIRFFVKDGDKLKLVDELLTPAPVIDVMLGRKNSIEVLEERDDENMYAVKLVDRAGNEKEVFSFYLIMPRSAREKLIEQIKKRVEEGVLHERITEAYHRYERWADEEGLTNMKMIEDINESIVSSINEPWSELNQILNIIDRFPP